MGLTLTAHQVSQPLVRPYRLSFGDVAAFDTVYVSLEGDGRLGIGEITPLPGYSHETIQSVREDVGRIRGILAGREVREWETIFNDLHATSPFVASGFLSALQTWREDFIQACRADHFPAIALTALCGASSPDKAGQEAVALADKGYGAIKIKVGRDARADLAIVEEVYRQVGERVSLRLDANQRLATNDAVRLCRALEGKENILLEQPFAPGNSHDLARLAQSTPVPIMQDESVWSPEDIVEAKRCGARLVKCKLCKHKGIDGTMGMIELARSEGLEVVFGNGVQSVWGNYLEAWIHGRCGVQTASEGNGFAKVASPLIRGGLSVRDGHLHAEPFTDLAGELAAMPVLISVKL